MRALLILALVVGRAEARDWMGLMDRMQGGSTLHYELTWLDAVDGPGQLVLAGARLHGFAGPSGRWALQMGLDLAAGGTIDRGGFAYDVALFPLGFALRLGATGFVGIAGGVGALGATPTADDALALPGELTFEVGNRVRLLGRARASYLAYTGEHRLLEGMLGLRIGHHYEDYGFPSGNGYFIAASVRQLGDARMIGATIGYSIDLATPRRSRRHAE